MRNFREFYTHTTGCIAEYNEKMLDGPIFFLSYMYSDVIQWLFVSLNDGKNFMESTAEFTQCHCEIVIKYSTANHRWNHCLNGYAELKKTTSGINHLKLGCDVLYPHCKHISGDVNSPCHRTTLLFHCWNAVRYGIQKELIWFYSNIFIRSAHFCCLHTLVSESLQIFRTKGRQPVKNSECSSQITFEYIQFAPENVLNPSNKHPLTWILIWKPHIVYIIQCLNHWDYSLVVVIFSLLL